MIETEELTEFKQRWEELAKEALKIFKKIRDLEAESTKLRERKKSGEHVKELLKQNKVELKRLRSKEFKIYHERKEVMKTQIERDLRVACPKCGELMSYEEHYRFTLGLGCILYPIPPGPIPPESLIECVCHNCGHKLDSLSKLDHFENVKKKLEKYLLNNYLLNNLTRQDQSVLAKRELELAYKLRIKDIKMWIVVFLILSIPILFLIIVVMNF